MHLQLFITSELAEYVSILTEKELKSKMLASILKEEKNPFCSYFSFRQSKLNKQRS